MADFNAPPTGRFYAPRDSPTAPGIIEPGSLMTVEEARARLRLGDWAWRQRRRAGLRVISVAGRSYVLSDDVIEHFKGIAGNGDGDP